VEVVLLLLVLGATLSVGTDIVVVDTAEITATAWRWRALDSMVLTRWASSSSAERNDSNSCRFTRFAARVSGAAGVGADTDTIARRRGSLSRELVSPARALTSDSCAAVIVRSDVVSDAAI
jgi:hypothetical protein